MSVLLMDHMALLEMVLRTVEDIGDSVFFFGGERAFLKWDVPFPTFSFAPQIGYGDMPFPWLESYKLEHNYYKKAEKDNNFSDAYYNKDQKFAHWSDRQPRAAFFVSMLEIRQVVYDSAAARPDLFDVSISFGGTFHAWNPLSNEENITGKDKTADNSTYKTENEHPGFIQPILQFNTGRHYVASQYKYVIVMLGTDALSTSGRLAGLIAHSGAVVLLQSSSFSYHFTARLVPWVHFVPISYSAADLIAKVQWLHDNDDKAQQIARNAANFGKSYLRLEDYFCYTASALKLISDLEQNTTALEGFTPHLIHRPQR